MTFCEISGPKYQIWCFQDLPAYKKWHFRDPWYKKMHFGDPRNKMAFVGPPYQNKTFSCQKSHYQDPLSKHGIFKPHIHRFLYWPSQFHTKFDPYIPKMAKIWPPRTKIWSNMAKNWTPTYQARSTVGNHFFWKYWFSKEIWRFFLDTRTYNWVTLCRFLKQGLHLKTNHACGQNSIWEGWYKG